MGQKASLGHLGFDDYMESFNKRVLNYFPSKAEWTPGDDALYKPVDLYRVPQKQADGLRFKAIRYIFHYHYNHNPSYQSFCKNRGVSPGDIKALSDFEKIPLLADKFYKDYPHGRDFALWLGNLFSSEIPRVVIRKKFPTFDDVINDFNATGLSIAYSSGTSGRHTFIPRDQRTFFASEYAVAKSAIAMIYPLWKYDMHGYLLMPNPHKTNVYAGKVTKIYFDVIKNIEVAIDREITADTIQATMSNKRSLKTALIKKIAQRVHKKMIERIILWLGEREKKGDDIAFVGAPFILHFVMNKLEDVGQSFTFGEGSGVITGGGWKIYEGNRMPVEQFRQRVEDILGIPSHNCLDIYGMVEGNGWMTQCPEGHYLHVPSTYFQPLILDDEFHPVGYKEWGRFAFLDGVAYSYPGFIISGDTVRLLEHCPVCDRPGPVLEPEIKRVRGEELRGCAEELRRVLSADLGE
jgi:hypothetical protein